MIKEITQWFERAVPNPTDRNESVQIGCHFEEVAEMMEALGLDNIDVIYMHNLANKFKACDYLYSIKRGPLLDALADQLVTATGVAHMTKMDLVSAGAEVNRSNWSKFVDGQPVFKANGKIDKGPAYTEPNLGGMY
jgi:hypothetical protein